jgi:menaquinone-9 beta-reductase
MSSFDVIIIGAGPAGCTVAALLADNGLRVVLLEEKRMPREKLCGEFIAPESFPALERLGVMSEMLAAGAQKITNLSLISSTGRSLNASISQISSGEDWAMSLSRSRFDQVLFDRARRAGATCIEGIAVREAFFESGQARGVEAMTLPDGALLRFEAPLVVDASGRNSRLMVDRAERVSGARGSRLYAMKAHLRGIEGIDEQVELCFFPGGYGGLSRVEDGLVNLCFIASEKTFSSVGGDPTAIVDRSVKLNPVARERLRTAELVGKWHSAGPLTFGRRRLARRGIIAIGDASGMIDPFTGTGIQVALRTGELAADAIIEAASGADTAEQALAGYAARYEHEFGKRMRVAGALRRIAFSPTAGNLFAGVMSRFSGVTRSLMKSTRSGANGRRSASRGLR